MGWAKNQIEEQMKTSILLYINFLSETTKTLQNNPS